MVHAVTSVTSDDMAQRNSHPEYTGVRVRISTSVQQLHPPYSQVMNQHRLPSVRYSPDRIRFEVLHNSHWHGQTRSTYYTILYYTIRGIYVHGNGPQMKYISHALCSSGGSGFVLEYVGTPQLVRLPAATYGESVGGGFER